MDMSSLSNSNKFDSDKASKDMVNAYQMLTAKSSPMDVKLESLKIIKNLNK
jgi:hypothetical protein